ncbi:CRISPR-associated RAMP protein Csx7 [Sorangium sp. So ce296]|uniref:type III CRISPR-associated RAMP protein Csx7 n=1 Tax=Sorangium sp. So ce296 TaxID=3133296 RepID=UPI003F6093D8
MFFDRFTRRVEIDATLACQTALRIGTGKVAGDIAASDLPVLKDGRGEPLVPGASLKGAIRSALEAVLRGIPEDPSASKAWACDPFLDPCVDPREEDRSVDQMRLAERAVWQRERVKAACRACQTFGTAGLASHVVFQDARPRGRARVERRDGVAIDRDLGRVSGGMKYDFEVLAAGAELSFSVAVDSAAPWQEGLLVLGLDLLDQGFIRIGGATSRGLGRVALQGARVRLLDIGRLRAGQGPTELTWDEFRQASLAAWAREIDAAHEAAEERAC